MFRSSNQNLSVNNHSAEPVAVSVVGLGAMGQRDVSHIAKSARFRLVGVYDLNRDVTRKVAQQTGAKAYVNEEEVLADSDTQAVFVCTPHHLLATYGLKILDSGKHLLLEKPMAIDSASADAVINLAYQRERIVSVNYSVVFTDAVAEAQRLVALGAVGDLIGVEIRWSYHKPAGYFHGAHSPTPDDWRLDKDKAGGGMVMMTTCHALLCITHITGMKILSVGAYSPPSTVQAGVEDTLHGILRFTNQASGALLTSSSQRGAQVYDTTIWGSNGTIVLHQNDLSYYSTRVIDGKRPGIWHVMKWRGSEDHIDQWLDDTARSIRGEKALTVDASCARDTLSVIEALYQSADSNSMVNVKY